MVGGLGLLALQLLWALTLLLALVVVRAGRRAWSAALVLGASAVTAALLLWPRGQEGPAPSEARGIVDTFLIGRFILLAVMSLVSLGSLFLLLIYHLMEPIYATPLHSR